MMDNLRAASNHVVLKIILGLIILSFVLTGVGNYLIGGNNDYAARVNGQEISRGQLEQAFNSERNRQQQMLGDQGVDRRHTGDIDDGDFRTGIDDALQQRFHHHLRGNGPPGAWVERGSGNCPEKL